MTTKDYLRQLRLLDIRIKQRRLQLSELRERAVSIGSRSDGEKVQTSMSNDKLSENVGRVVDIENEINRMIVIFEEKKHNLIGEIQSLDDDRFVELLYKRYVEFKRFEQIACEMNHSFDYILKLHGQAIRAFEKDVL
jgi:hypothetical protein